MDKTPNGFTDRPNRSIDFKAWGEVITRNRFPNFIAQRIIVKTRKHGLLRVVYSNVDSYNSHMRKRYLTFTSITRNVFDACGRRCRFWNSEYTADAAALRDLREIASPRADQRSILVGHSFGKLARNAEYSLTWLSPLRATKSLTLQEIP